MDVPYIPILIGTTSEVNSVYRHQVKFAERHVMKQKKHIPLVLNVVIRGVVYCVGFLVNLSLSYSRRNRSSTATSSLPNCSATCNAVRPIISSCAGST